MIGSMLRGSIAGVGMTMLFMVRTPLLLLNGVLDWASRLVSVGKPGGDQSHSSFAFTEMMTISIVVTYHETRPCSGQAVQFL